MYSRRRFIQATGTAAMALLLSSCDLFKGAPPDDQQPKVQQIQVILKEWQIVPSKILAKAGKVRFVVRNDGTMEHGFEIEGELKGAKFEEVIEPFPAGKTQTLEVELAPGEYEVYCQVSGHKELGMTGTVIVSEAKE